MTILDFSKQETFCKSPASWFNGAFMRRGAALISLTSLVISVTICGCTSTQDAAETLAREKQHAWVDQRSNNFASAIVHYQKAVEAAHGMTDHPLALPDSLNDLGQACLAEGDQLLAASKDNAQLAQSSFEHALQSYQAAVHQYELVIAHWTPPVPQPATLPSAHPAELVTPFPGLCQALDGEANAFTRLNQPDNAKRIFEQARRQARIHGLSDHWRRIDVEYVALLKNMGKQGDAQLVENGLVTMSVASELPRGAEQLEYLAHQQLKLGRQAEKKNDLNQALQEYGKGYNAALHLSDKREAIGFATRIGMLFLTQANYPAAERAFRAALTWCKVQPCNAMTQLTAMRGEMLALTQQQRLAEAEAPAMQAVQLSETLHSQTAQEVRRAWADLSNLYAKENKKDLAIPLMVKTYKKCLEVLPIASPETATAVCDLSDLYGRFGMDDENHNLMRVYTREAMRATKDETATAAKLFNDRADADAKAGNGKQSALLTQSAQILLRGKHS
jgi:tetratricopeptide (TPR) repeat protein